MVKSAGEHEIVWDLRGNEGMKMRDTKVGLGGRFDLLSPGAYRGVEVGCSCLIKED